MWTVVYQQRGHLETGRQMGIGAGDDRYSTEQYLGIPREIILSIILTLIAPGLVLRTFMEF